MTNLEKAVDCLFGKQLNGFISYIKIHKLNNSEGPTFLKKTHNMLAGDPEELDCMSIYSRVKECPTFDVIDGFGIYHTKCLPKKYWTKKMRTIVSNGDPKAYYGAAAGDLVIIYDNIPYFIDIKISEKDIQQKDDGSYIYFTGSIPLSSLNNFPNGDGKHFYLLFPKDVNEPNGKICMVDADALVIARDGNKVRLRNNNTAYLAQDMLKLDNAAEVIKVLG